MRKIFAALTGMCLLVVLGSCQSSNNTPDMNENSMTWQEQYDLGMRYLSEGNYAEAIIAFTAAIEIDPKQADAFMGRGDAYIGMAQNTESNESAKEYYRAALEDYEEAQLLGDGNADAKIEEVKKIMSDMETHYESDDFPEPQPIAGYPKTERHDGQAGDYWTIEYNQFGKRLHDIHYDENEIADTFWDFEYDTMQRLTQVTNGRFTDGKKEVYQAYYLNEAGWCYRDELIQDGQVIRNISYDYSNTPTVEISYSGIGISDRRVVLSGLIFEMSNPDHYVVLSGYGGESGREGKGFLAFSEVSTNSSEFGKTIDSGVIVQKLGYFYDSNDNVIDVRTYGPYEDVFQ